MYYINEKEPLRVKLMLYSNKKCISPDLNSSREFFYLSKNVITVE